MYQIFYVLLILLSAKLWGAAETAAHPIVIVIDPGHGGKDLGTHSKQPRYREKELTLTTAKLVANVLQKLGYRVLFTRTTDLFVGLDERAIFANKESADLFVSIHFNSAPNKQAHGIEVYFYDIPSDDPERPKSSKKLAQATMDGIVHLTQAASRGVRHGNFAVIRETKMPAILVECGFLTNEEEMAKLLSKEYLKQLARGIAQGVHTYCKNDPKFKASLALAKGKHP